MSTEDPVAGMPGIDENAYALLTNIQGFDSFSLGPHSSIDEIQRAFHTQSLIWHPDKNPGDTQAVRIYKRMKRSYDILMDPTLRKAHDERMTANACTVTAGRESPPRNGRSGGAVRQPPPEDLGAPPPSAKPFAYVDREPHAATPACKAGLRRGDAILRLGEATHLREVPDQLIGSVGEPLPALVIDVHGRFLKKWVVPHAWDHQAPASLLGCQMSDQCPLDLIATHPVEVSRHRRLKAVEQVLGVPCQDNTVKNGAASASARSSARGGSSRIVGPSCGHSNGHGSGPGAPSGNSMLQRSAQGVRNEASAAVRTVSRGGNWMPRIILFLASLANVGLGLTIMIFPAVSYGVFNVWELPFLHCNQVIAYRYRYAYPPFPPGLAPHPPSLLSPPSPLSSLPTRLQHEELRARQLLKGDSFVPAVGEALPPAWPPMPSGSSGSPGSPARPPTHGQDTATPPRPPLRGTAPPSAHEGFFAPPPPPPPPPPSALVHLLAPPSPSSDSVFGQGIVQSESTPSAAAHTDAPMAAFVHEWTATNLGVDLIRNAMLYILMGSAVMIAISLVGLVLACLPPSRLRGALMALYLCAGLPSWVFLVFVAVGAVALRDSAAALVTTYWDCLKDLSPTHASSIPHRFTEMEAAAGCCIAAAVLLLVGLLAACRVVGWRHLARHTVGIVSLFRGLVGVSFLGLGIVLKLTSQVEDVLFDWLVIGLGGATLCISVLGVCGSRNESKRLLRVYTLLLFALLSAIFGVAVYLLVDVTDALSSWFDASWAAMATHVCASALSPSCAAAAALDPNEWMNASSWTSSPVITRQEVHALAASHLLSITTLVVLLFLVLLFDLVMACVLQYLVGTYGREEPSADEREMLAPAGDDEEVRGYGANYDHGEDEDEDEDYRM